MPCFLKNQEEKRKSFQNSEIFTSNVILNGFFCPSKRHVSCQNVISQTALSEHDVLKMKKINRDTVPAFFLSFGSSEVLVYGLL